jgi:hypothetical protein
MAALPSTPDIFGDGRHGRFVPTADSCAAAKPPLFNDLAGAREEEWRHRKAERLGGLEVEDQLEFRGLLDRQSAGFSPLRMRPV